MPILESGMMERPFPDLPLDPPPEEDYGDICERIVREHVGEFEEIVEQIAEIRQDIRVTAGDEEFLHDELELMYSYAVELARAGRRENRRRRRA